MTTQRQLDLVVLLGAAARTTTVEGGAVDLQGYANIGGREMKAVLDVGVITTAGPLAAKMQHSDTTTAADFTDIPGAAWDGYAITQTTPITQVMHFRTTKRYVRPVITFTNGGGHSFGVYLLAERRME